MSKITTCFIVFVAIFLQKMTFNYTLFEQWISFQILNLSRKIKFLKYGGVWVILALKNSRNLEFYPDRQKLPQPYCNITKIYTTVDNPIKLL